MNKETINKINNNLILLVEGFEDAERDYNYDLANEKHYVSEIIALVKKLTLTDVSQQRELLVAFAEWILSSEEDITSEMINKDVNTFLETNCG